jgi:hypothetical protein
MATSLLWDSLLVDVMYVDTQQGTAFSQAVYNLNVLQENK